MSQNAEQILDVARKTYNELGNSIYGRSGKLSLNTDVLNAVIDDPYAGPVLTDARRLLGQDKIRLTRGGSEVAESLWPGPTIGSWDWREKMKPHVSSVVGRFGRICSRLVKMEKLDPRALDTNGAYQLIATEALRLVVLVNGNTKVTNAAVLASSVDSIVDEMISAPEITEWQWGQLLWMSNRQDRRRQIINEHLETGLAIPTCHERITKREREQEQRRWQEM